MSFKILVINPGSTSTKISIFDGDIEVMSEKIRHEANDLIQFSRIIDQKEYRYNWIIDTISKNNFVLAELDAVVGRGGLLSPIPSGTYRVNQKMLEELITTKQDHASNLGAILAFELAAQTKNKEAFIVDPVVVDEFTTLARYTGLKFIKRRSIFHALNHKAQARKIAEKLGRNYTACNFVVAHMGGGISIGAHLKGRVIDNNNALDGEGPFSPERTGTLPTGQWLDFIFNNIPFKTELKKYNKGLGGWMSYLGTTDAILVEKKIKEGDKYCEEVVKAMCYQIAKEIGAYATVLMGKVDRIILTGGLAYSSLIIKEISERVQWIAPIEVLAGENEMEALWLGTKRVLEKEDVAKEYDFDETIHCETIDRQ